MIFDLQIKNINYSISSMLKKTSMEGFNCKRKLPDFTFHFIILKLVDDII